MNNKFIIIAITFLVTLGGLKLFIPPKVQKITRPPITHINPIEESPKVSPPTISTPIPYHLSYSDMVNQLKTWNEEAKDITEIGTYGKSTKGIDLHYIKLNNKLITGNKPKVLITACIHGNEPWATSIVMAYIGTLLDQYGKNEKITKLIDEREIWFIPIVSPDSFPNSRFVDGVDPNRDFPTKQNPNKESVTPIMRLRELVLKEKFNAIASGHTWGRQYLMPWGCSYEKIPHEKEYQEIIGEMAKLSNYTLITPKEIYNKPIYGAEVDWYYMNGAMAIVIEYGTHQRIPSKADVDYEFKRTFESILIFIDKAPIALSKMTI